MVRCSVCISIKSVHTTSGEACSVYVPLISISLSILCGQYDVFCTIIGGPELAGNGGNQNLAFISHTVYTKPRIIQTSGRTGTHSGYLHFSVYKVGVKM